MKKAGFEFTPVGIAGVIVDGIRETTIKRAAAEGADLLELRVDTFTKRAPEDLVEEVKRLKRMGGAGKLPLIVTVRSKAEGGRFSITDGVRAEIFRALLPYADFIDIEIRSMTRFEDILKAAKRHKKRVIASYHNFRTTPGPAALRDIIRRARQKGGDIVKVAATANSPGDLKRLAGLLLKDRGLIIIAMGRFGRPSRVFFPLLGSLITYGSLTKATAPGQIPVSTIRKEFDLYGF